MLLFTWKTSTTSISLNTRITLNERITVIENTIINQCIAIIPPLLTYWSSWSSFSRFSSVTLKYHKKILDFPYHLILLSYYHLTTFTGFHHVLLTLPGLPGGPCNPAVSSDNLSKNSMNFILVLISLGS